MNELVINYLDTDSQILKRNWDWLTSLTYKIIIYDDLKYCLWAGIRRTEKGFVVKYIFDFKHNKEVYSMQVDLDILNDRIQLLDTHPIKPISDGAAILIMDVFMNIDNIVTIAFNRINKLIDRNSKNYVYMCKFLSSK